MKKILAAIVEYKLTRSNLEAIRHQIHTKLTNKTTEYPDIFVNKMRELLVDIHDIAQQSKLSEKDEAMVSDILKEMEIILVDYLSSVYSSQTNDCFYH